MKTMRFLLLMVFVYSYAYGREGITGWCQRGAQVVVAPSTVGGTPLTRSFQQSYPSCTVSVYITGSGGTLAPIYSNNTGTTLANPFTATTMGQWNFYADNGTYDIQISGGGLPSPFTFGAVSTFDFLNQSALYLSQAFARNLSGGYIQLPPITYPTSGCLDKYGNPVNIPVPPSGFPTFSANDTIMWVSASPLNGVSPPGCATALPANNTYGLNTNSYILAMGGLATSNTSFNSIHSFQGGVTAGSYTAGLYYPAGTITTTGPLATGTYLGGYVQIGHSIGPPATGTIATTNNPLTQFDGINQGTMYWDDALGCVNVYNGTSFNCVGSGGGGGGTPGGSNTSVQYNNNGAFGGDFNLFWSPTTQLLTAKATDSAHPSIIAASGFMQADNGFLATPSSATNFDVIQAPGGGMEALSFSAVKYVQTGHQDFSVSGNPALTANDHFHQGALTWDDHDGCEKVFSGTSWTCLGGGGSGSPAGANTQIQFNNSGAFGASPNLAWINSSNQLTLTGTVVASVGFSTPNTLINSIQAPFGGVEGLFVTASDSLFFLERSSPPALSDLAQSRIYDDAMSHSLKVSLNGGAYVGVATSNGTLTNGNCVSIDANHNFVDAGGPCTTGGGGGTVSSGVATEIAYYPATGTTVGGSTFFTWDNTARKLSLTTVGATAGIGVVNGFVQADTGFLATTGTATLYNSFNAPTAGMAGKSFTATTYVQSGNYSGLLATGPAATTADTFHAGALSWSTASNCEAVFNGTTWVCLAGSGGGVSSLNTLTGALTINGTTNEIIVTPSGSSITLTTPQAIGTASSPTFAAVTGTTFNSTATGSTIGLQVNGGVFQVNGNGAVSAGGVITSTAGMLVTTINNYNAIQTSGGMAATQGFFPFGQTCAFLVAPGSGFGGLSYQGGSNYCFWDGSNWQTVNLATTGGGVTSITGTANEIIASASTGAVNLSTPQPIATSSAPTFAAVTAATFNATNTGTGVAFQTASPFNFQVNGNGVISTAGGVHINSGASSPQIDASSLGGPLTIHGATSGNGNIVLTPGNVGGSGTVVVNAANVSQPAMSIHNATGSTTNTHVWEIVDASNTPIIYTLTSQDTGCANCMVTQSIFPRVSGGNYQIGGGGNPFLQGFFGNDDGSLNGALNAGSTTGQAISALGTTPLPTIGVSNSGGGPGIQVLASSGFGITDVSPQGSDFLNGFVVGGHVRPTGSSPTVGCTSGTPPNLVMGNDFFGVTSQISGTCVGNLTITFHTAYGSTPACVASSSAPLNVFTFTTAVVIALSGGGSMGSGTTVSYICAGN